MAKWLKIEEAAAHLDIEKGELMHLLDQGQGPRCYRKGPLVRFAAEDLDAWVEAQLAGQDPDNSEGWSEQPAGTLAAEAESASDAEAPGDLTKLYEGKQSLILGPDGRAPENERTDIRISTRPGFSGTDDWGVTRDFPNAAEGIPDEFLAGVDVCPPHVVQSSVESPDEQRKMIQGRLAKPALGRER